MKKRQLIVTGSILLTIAGWAAFTFASSQSEYTPARQLTTLAGLVLVAVAMYLLVRRSPVSAAIVGIVTSVAGLAEISLWVVFTSHSNGDRVQALLNFLMETGLIGLIQLPGGVLVAVGGLLAAAGFAARLTPSQRSRRGAVAAGVATPLATIVALALIVLGNATVVYEAQLASYPAPPSTSNTNEYLPILLNILAGVAFAIVALLGRLAPVGSILAGAILLVVGIAGLFGLGETWLGAGAVRTIELVVVGGMVSSGAIAFIGAAILAIGFASRHRKDEVALPASPV